MRMVGEIGGLSVWLDQLEDLVWVFGINIVRRISMGRGLKGSGLWP